MAARFELGQLLITPNARDTLVFASIQEALTRHASRDWGELGDEDKHLNDQALVEGTRLLSAYRDANNVKFWIITEADRSATTVLLPEDY